MNLLDFQKAGIEKGELTEDEIGSYCDRNVLLNFRKKEGAVISSYKGEEVWPAGSSGITEGTWICSLDHVGRSWFASPVRRVDASFFMELKRSQKDEVLEALWRDFREEMEPHFRELYLESTKADIEKAVLSATEELRKENERLRDENRDLKSGLIPPSVPHTVPAEGFLPMETVTDRGIPVRRISESLIRSPFFTAPKYFVHVSLDLKTLYVQQHDFGTVTCSDNCLILTSLNTISPFSEEYDMPAQYVPGKGLYITLK